MDKLAKVKMQVRRFLRTKRGQEASDRAVATQFECSRQTVKKIRIALIAAGLHPSVQTRKGRGDNPMYKPGASANGGYVFDENGKVIRELEWYLRQQAKLKKKI